MYGRTFSMLDVMSLGLIFLAGIMGARAAAVLADALIVLLTFAKIKRFDLTSANPHTFSISIYKRSHIVRVLLRNGQSVSLIG